MPKHKLLLAPGADVESEDQKSPLENLPKDTLEYMLSFLSLGDLNNVFPVSKTLNQLSSTERFYSNEKIPKAFMPRLKSKKARLFQYLESEALKEIKDHYPEEFIKAMGGAKAFMEVPKFKQESDITLESMFGYKMVRYIKDKEGHIALCVKKYYNRYEDKQINETIIKFINPGCKYGVMGVEFDLPYILFGFTKYNATSWEYLNRLLNDKPCGGLDWTGKEKITRESKGESIVSLTDQLLPKNAKNPKGFFSYFQSLLGSDGTSSSQSAVKRRKF